jgi:Pvc16 N-terminal domain
MSDFSAIAAVTNTLKALIEQEIAGLTVEVLKAPVVLSGTSPLLSLYLYRVEPNPFTTNLDWQVRSETELVAAPFGLNLHFLLTPYGPDEIEIQRTLGEVMRVFHENSMILNGDPLLDPVLTQMTEELRIVPRTLPLGEMIDLWRSFDKASYRLSTTYEVSTVLIDSRVSRNVQRVQERVIDVGPMR